MATAETKLHVPEFTNEPFIDFSNPDNRTQMEDALKKVASEFGREYPMWIGGKRSSPPEREINKPFAPLAGHRRVPGCLQGASHRGD